jgi:hypothetical protein
MYQLTKSYLTYLKIIQIKMHHSSSSGCVNFMHYLMPSPEIDVDPNKALVNLEGSVKTETDTPLSV